MKWDMWDLEYPNQILMSDALAAHTLPLWNPLMQYGAPWFAAIGTPVWYPITMMFALIGYNPQMLSWVYILHVAIGGFGMYLFTRCHLSEGNNEHGGRKIIITSFLIGMLYCGNGVFLSNAQHMMIIISASWVPYVFYHVRLYLAREEKYYVLLGGLFAGQILLGGYPEIFYNMFLYLFCFVLYFTYSPSRKIITNVVYAFKKYMMIVICTIFAGMITVLPFLCNMSNLGRANSAGQIPNGYTFVTLFSLFVPRMSRYVSGVECSMVNYYSGLLTIILLPVALMKKIINKKICIFIAGIAFLLCWPKQIFLHSVLYKLLPMYDTFRFPTLNRIFVSIFILLLVSNVIVELLDKESSKYDVVVNAGILTCVVLFMFFIEVADIFDKFFNKEQIGELKSSLLITSILLGMYLICQVMTWGNGRIKKLGKIFICVLIPMEIFIFCCQETDITIALFKPHEYVQNEGVRDYISAVNTSSENRNRNVNFAGNARSTNKLNSNAIVNNKVFDEDGYVCFKQLKTELYKKTYNHSIIETNPVVYFTNDVVSSKEREYEEWVNDCAVSSEQIWVEGNELEKSKESVSFEEPKTLFEEALMLTVDEEMYYISGELNARDECTGRIRLYLNGINKDLVQNSLTFFSGETFETYKGEYNVKTGESGKYIDVYFPEIGKTYDSISVQISEGIIEKAYLVVTERLTEDKFVAVTDWGFNDINMNITAPTNGYVTVLQAYHTGWKAYVDGKETEITLIDECFMGIQLPEGEHVICMEFVPIDFWVGCIVSVGYFIVCVLVLFIKVRRMRVNTYYNNQCEVF